MSSFQSKQFNELIENTSVNISGKIFVEVLSNEKLYEFLLEHIAKHSVDAKSFVARHNEEENNISLQIGLGVFSFIDFKGKPLIAIHRIHGDPVSSSKGPVIYKSLTIFTDESEAEIAKFFQTLVESKERAAEGLVHIYSWDENGKCWGKTVSNVKCRDLDTVYLPKKAKSGLVRDIEEFLNPKTKEFFERKGLPYRKSYFLHGVSGSGKTSLVFALAKHFHKNVCILKLSNPHLNDDDLALAIAKLPAGSLVLLEEGDFLFTKQITNTHTNLTLNGLLSSLDSFTNTLINNDKLIFITTRNTKEELHPSIVHFGRINYHLHFDYATDEQIKAMWRSFFNQPNENEGDLADEFCTRLREKLKNKNDFVMNNLENFLVHHLNHSPQEVLEKVSEIVEDLKHY
jgi:chaperone BCS1